MDSKSHLRCSICRRNRVSRREKREREKQRAWSIEHRVKGVRLTAKGEREGKGVRRQEAARMEVGGSLRLDFAHLRLRLEARDLLV